MKRKSKVRLYNVILMVVPILVYIIWETMMN